MGESFFVARLIEICSRHWQHKARAMVESPYKDVPEEDWLTITSKLIERFPLNMDLVTSVVERAWDDFFNSSIGTAQLRFGLEIFLPPQATGVILERLISIELARRDHRWRNGQGKNEKDIVCSFDEQFSFEIKTSSSLNGVFGNRSTGHKSSASTKHRSGYYLVINYKLPKEGDLGRKIRKIRFGWIDDEDWIGQKSSSGQQARLTPNVANSKLVTLNR